MNDKILKFFNSWKNKNHDRNPVCLPKALALRTSYQSVRLCLDDLCADFAMCCVLYAVHLKTLIDDSYVCIWYWYISRIFALRGGWQRLTAAPKQNSDFLQSTKHKQKFYIDCCGRREERNMINRSTSEALTADAYYCAFGPGLL